VISRIHQRLGTAGFVISIVALIAALGGTAFAAAKLNSTQKKEVTKIAQTEAKKYAGKTGPAGPAGSNGTNGATGPEGKQGPEGKEGPKGNTGNTGNAGTSAKGTSFTGEKTVGSVTCKEGGIKVTSAEPETAVCNGEKGQTGFTSTLPSGKTETGTWGIVVPKTGNEVEPIVPISFPIPIAQADESAFYFTAAEVEAGEFGSSGCHWELGKPGARPESRTAGTLCIFEEFGENLSFSFIQSPGVGAGYGPSGTFLHLSTTSTHLANAIDGVWAVTAP